MHEKSHDDQTIGRLPPSAAAYISESERRLSGLVTRQFRFMVLATLLPTIILAVALRAIPLIIRAPTNAELIDLLADSNRHLSEVARTLLQSSPTVTTTTPALQAVLLQADLHEQAVEGLRRTQQQPTAQSQTIIQLIGSAAILALLGALGLQRLQNIDTEIHNLRESVSAQAEAHARSNRIVLRSQIDNQVQKRFAEARSDVQKVVDSARETQDTLEGQANEILGQVREQVVGLNAQMAEVRDLVDTYPWLRSKQEFEAASRVRYLKSVDDAQSLAEDFRRSADTLSAREALKSIIDHELSGSYSDFHNAYSEARRTGDTQLALGIVELGLTSFPDQADLIADKAQALKDLGRAQEARQLIEDWRQRKPDEFARSWRPVVFYEDVFDSLELTPEALTSLESAFEEVTQKLRHEIKPWSEYADLMVKQGRLDKAEAILRQALELNPLSQQLNYVLGEVLLKQGRAEDSIDNLEQALLTDYQDQYQHDVNQYAVRARLAQAYEAAGRPDAARPLYQSIVDARHREALASIKDYARSRLSAIALMGGEVPDEAEEEPTHAQLVELLASITDEPVEQDDIDGEPLV